MVQSHIHSIYHVFDAKGVFDSNPANIGARDKDGASLYKGPERFPMMLYHPQGEERIVERERKEKTAYGIEIIPAKYEMIHRLVTNVEEEREARAAGWLDHPAKALKAAGKEAPPISADFRIQNLEDQIAEFAAEKAELEREKLEFAGEQLKNAELRRQLDEEIKAREAAVAKLAEQGNPLIPKASIAPPETEAPPASPLDRTSKSK